MRQVTRREFLATTAVAGLGLAAAGRLGAEETVFKTKLQKAMITGRPVEPQLAKLKAAGFGGVETGFWNAKPDEAEDCRKVAEKVGMKIQSVLRGWMEFNSQDAAVVAKSVADTETSLRAAQGYGADAILLVPCRIGGMPMPEPWDFDIEFDPKTGHLKRVVKGDNEPFKAYIAAHDQAVDGSVAAVRKLIPVAEETKVVIALENVWNNLWVKPEIFTAFVKSFDNPWVKAYFDIGNHVKYAPSEQWIGCLGSLIAKCHVKDFKLNADGHGGNFCNIRDGSVDWPVVRKALEAAGYSGWMTIEGGDCSLAEHSKRLGLIIAGQ
ncbi:MAG: sugar phosphate isomerase/epimerase [Planctomycetes bacterium]|nr:sugar phosphate isomerase/epimerase [Planctomycetota bacterium]